MLYVWCLIRRLNKFSNTIIAGCKRKECKGKKGSTGKKGIAKNGRSLEQDALEQENLAVALFPNIRGLMKSCHISQKANEPRQRETRH